MFDVAPTELLLVAAVALLVIGPKDLPRAMRFAGKWVGRARGVARQFRSGFDTMVREAELSEMEQQWAEENARIMREHPQPALTGPDSAYPPDTAYPEMEYGADDSPPVMVEQPDMLPQPQFDLGEAEAPAKPKRVRKPKADKPAEETES